VSEQIDAMAAPKTNRERWRIDLTSFRPCQLARTGEGFRKEAHDPVTPATLPAFREGERILVRERLPIQIKEDGFLRKSGAMDSLIQFCHRSSREVCRLEP
jgi:hypothetical protein